MKATIYPDAMVSGWTVNFSQVNIDILPQGTKSYDFKITSPVGVKPGDYQIGVYVRASTMASLARATYRVTVPKPISPIGTPVRDY